MKALKLEVHLIMMVGGANPINPKDEDAVVEMLCSGLAVAKKYKLPIIALGLGEKEDDLQIFEAEKFADAFTQIN